jgi:hypothetical protein
MSAHVHIRLQLLRSLRAAGGEPMPENALVDAAQFLVRPTPGAGDVLAELGDLERAGFVVSQLDMFTNVRSYTLTTAGELKAKELAK